MKITGLFPTYKAPFPVLKSETTCVYTYEPALHSIKKELWQTDIAGDGEPLYSVDFEACYSYLTSISLTDKLCERYPYERFMELLPEGHPAKTNIKKAKVMFISFSNGSERDPFEKDKKKKLQPETIETTRRAILKTLGISDTDFKTITEAQPEMRKQCGTIMNLVMKKAVKEGMNLIIPIVDGFYTTEVPERIQGLMYEASYEIVGYELPVKIKPQSQYYPVANSTGTPL